MSLNCMVLGLIRHCVVRVAGRSWWVCYQCQWFSGKIQRCHRWAPGLIPGWCTFACSHCFQSCRWTHPSAGVSTKLCQVCIHPCTPVVEYFWFLLSVPVTIYSCLQYRLSFSFSSLEVRCQQSKCSKLAQVISHYLANDSLWHIEHD